MVKRYIQQQEEHHRKKTYQEEYLALLRESGIEYDERYLGKLRTFCRPSRAFFFADILRGFTSLVQNWYREKCEGYAVGRCFPRLGGRLARSSRN